MSIVEVVEVGSIGGAMVLYTLVQLYKFLPGLHKTHTHNSDTYSYNLAIYQISKVVHLKPVAKEVSILVMLLNELSIGPPHSEPMQGLSLIAIVFAVCFSPLGPC